MKKANTKTLKSAYARYQQSSNYTLRDCYENYSYAKERAFNYCKELCEKFNGNDLKIISYNTFGFSCGFVGLIENKKVFVYITKDYDRFLELE